MIRLAPFTCGSLLHQVLDRGRGHWARAWQVRLEDPPGAFDLMPGDGRDLRLGAAGLGEPNDGRAPQIHKP